MRSHIVGESREQVHLLPRTIEEYVGEDSAVRVIDAYVDSLDIGKLGFKKADLADIGRLPYHPGILLKLYIYGYFYGIRSSRKLEKDVEKFLSEIEINDQGELKIPKADAAEIKKKISNLDERLAEYRRLYAEMQETGESQASLTDPDSRRMMTGQGKTEVSYNVQMSVDSKHNLIVDYEATNACNDTEQLHSMAAASKEALRLVRIGIHDGQQVRLYKTDACKACQARAQCTSSEEGRTVRRTEAQDAMDALKKRVEQNKEKTKVRGQIVEPVFGTLKSAMGLRHFLLRGLQKVQAEVGLGAIAFNMKRAINILSVPALLAAFVDSG